MMSSHLEATRDHLSVKSRINVLVAFAQSEGRKGNEDNRSLFLKLAVVLIVTQFQVYVERSLAEFQYEVKQLRIYNKHLPTFLRLKSLKFQIEKTQIHQVLVDTSAYNDVKLTEIEGAITRLSGFCGENETLPADFDFVKKYPLGKQGLKELKDLYKQIEGKDIFEGARFDINKLNEILARRHNIIHEDGNHQITEVTVRSYRDFISRVVNHIDLYLYRNIMRLARNQISEQAVEVV